MTDLPEEAVELAMRAGWPPGSTCRQNRPEGETLRRAIVAAAPFIREQERERLLSDEAIQRGERVLDDNRVGEASGEARTDYALVKRILIAALDDQEDPDDAI